MDTYSQASMSRCRRFFRLGLLAVTVVLLLVWGHWLSPSCHPWHFCVSLFLVASVVTGIKVMRISPFRMMCYCLVAELLLLY